MEQIIQRPYQMKNILLFMPYGSVGGMEKLAYTFYTYYKSMGYKVTAVKIIKLADDIVNFGEDEIGLSLKDFAAYSKAERIKFYYSIPKKLKTIIKDKEIDHTISFGDMANCFSALSKTSERKTASIHALKSVELSSKTLMNKLFELSYKTIYKRFNKVVCISQGIKKDLLDNFDYKFDNLEVIYNPHDFSYIQNRSLEEIDNEFEENIFEKNVVLFLGRLSVQKAPWHLINAFFLSNQKEANLVFIGDGSAVILNLLSKQAADLGITDRVFFLGRKENPYKYLKRSKVIALTSYYEGTPNVIAEAIALEIPVISSNCTDGITEMMSLRHGKEYGRLLLTEAGIITPSFFEGKLEIPTDFCFTPIEKAFAEALDYYFENSDYFKEILTDNKNELKKKYNLPEVGTKYIAST